MGVNNRQRRAAKARQRARQQHQHHARTAARPAGGAPITVRDLLLLAATHPDAELLGVFDALAAADPALVAREAEGLLLAGVDALWAGGWQPAEAIRLGRRVDARAGRLMAAVVAADHARRDPATLHARWVQQLASLDLPHVAPSGWTGLVASDTSDRETAIRAVTSSLGAIYGAGRLHTVLTPPGGSASRSFVDHDAAIDDPVLVRVRALLAQAESTTFEAEAEAFTAKAQELMARHAIDGALLWSTSERPDRPTTIRIPVDDPYADIKSLLLHAVGRHARCRTVWDDRHALATVVGFAGDVAGVELLFTSLLVQSQSAMHAEGARAGPGGRARSRAFRASFLMAYTGRIDHRLAEINRFVEASADAQASGALLPVLASRADAVDDEVAALFGELRSVRVGGATDAAGWTSGARAGDLAQLHGPLRSSSPEPTRLPRPR